MKTVLLGGWSFPARALAPLAAPGGWAVYGYDETPDFPVDDEPWVLAGWSLGALRALAAVASGVVRPAALVLIGATARFCEDEDYACGVERAALRSMRHGLRRDPGRTLAAFHGLVGTTPPTEQDAGALDRGLRDLDTIDVRTALDVICMPVLLLHGKRDRVIPLAAAEWLAARLPEATLRVCEEAGHDLPLRYPEWVHAQRY